MKPKLLADIRYTATFEPNSANAAKAVVNVYQAKYVLVEALFCNWNEEGNIVFVPIHRPEYRELETTEGTLWRNKYPKDILPNFTIIQSLQIIRELEEIWVIFAFKPAYYERALKVLWKVSNGDHRFIVVAANALPRLEECRGLRRADPTGEADFTLIAGEEEASNNRKGTRQPTIFLGSGRFADVHTAVVP
jgi:hypothetical protein